jgi:hypothetical protein
MLEKKSSDFDGIYFLPGDEDDELVLSFFDFQKDMAGGKPIKVSELGHMYHIAFFKRDKNNRPMFDDSFEAILAGCVIRKTEKSDAWFDDYLKKTMGHVKIREMIDCLMSILDSKQRK